MWAGSRVVWTRMQKFGSEIDGESEGLVEVLTAIKGIHEDYT